MVLLTDEITMQTKVDYEAAVRGVVASLGFDSYVGDLSSVDSKGLSDRVCEVLVRFLKQSSDRTVGVHVDKCDMDVGALRPGYHVRLRFGRGRGLHASDTLDGGHRVPSAGRHFC